MEILWKRRFRRVLDDTHEDSAEAVHFPKISKLGEITVFHAVEWDNIELIKLCNCAYFKQGKLSEAVTQMCYTKRPF